MKLGTVKTPGFSFPVVTGRTYAVKLIQKKFIMEEKNKEIVFRERKILEKLKHPFIVTLHYTFQTDPALSASPLPSPTAWLVWLSYARGELVGLIFLPPPSQLCCYAQTS